jgi:tetratricopeptide (TPR) repeat protein
LVPKVGPNDKVYSFSDWNNNVRGKTPEQIAAASAKASADSEMATKFAWENSAAGGSAEERAATRAGFEKSAASQGAAGNYQQALDSHAKAWALSSSAEEAKQILGKMAKMLSDMSNPPKQSDAARRHVVGGGVYVKEGNFKGALVEFIGAINEAPYSARLYYNAANVLGELKEYQKAIDMMNLYLYLAPEAPDTAAAKDEVFKWEFMLKRG